MKKKYTNYNKSIFHLRFIYYFTIISFLSIISFPSSANAQSIPSSLGTVNCWDCAPNGNWVDVSGTPDVSNVNNAAGGTNGRLWINRPLPLPPNGHTHWITIRDVNSQSGEEIIRTTMTGLVIGREYEVVIYSMTNLATSPYAVSYLDTFFFQIEGGSRVSVVPTQNAWGVNKLRFTATATTRTISFYPGFNGTSGYEAVNISVTLDAINTVPIAMNDDVTSIGSGPVTVNVVANDSDPDGSVVASTVDLNPSAPGIQNSITTSQGTWFVNSSGILTFTPAVGFYGTATLPYTVQDNYTVAGSNPLTSAPATSAPAMISITILLDSDGDGIPDIDDLDDDNDGILDTDEGYCNQKAVYVLDAAATVAAASINSNGGNFNLIFRLQTGSTAVPSLGNQFSIPFSYSAMSYSANAWEGINVLGASSLAIRPNVTRLYTGLPANNSTTETSTQTYPEQVFTELLATNKISQLGTYTATIGSIPVPLPTDNAILSDTHMILHSAWNMAGSNPTYSSGYYSKITIQSDIVDYGNYAESEYLEVNYGTTYTYDYTAFTNTPGAGAGNDGNRGFIQIRDAKIEFCLPLDTDGDGIPDYLDLDSDGDGCPDALEANSDLDYNDLNSDGSINASVGGTGDTYPGVPNNSPAAGVGTSLDPNLQAAECNPCDSSSSLFLDSDGDGIADLCDSDDDNDGILDADECIIDPIAAFVSNNFTTVDPLIPGSTADNTKFLTIRPSDFGFTTHGATNVSGTHDFSDFYGMPAGSVIVNVQNGNVHPIANEFYTSALTSKTTITITGTVGQYVVFNHGQEYYGTQERGFEFSPATLIGLMSFATQATGGNWVSGNIGNYYYVRHIATNTQNAPFFMGNTNPQVMTKQVIVSTNNVEPTEYSTYFISILPECDTDLDGIPNRLDLDSDADGCPDAFEGGAEFEINDLVMAGGTVSGGSTLVNQNLCADGSCVDANGIPQFTIPPTGYSNTTGQTAGDSQDDSINECYCTEDPIGGTPDGFTKVGVSAMSSQTPGWPENIPNGWITMESKTQGFVITRVEHVGGGADGIPASTDSILDPREGMLVYDIQDACVKLFNGIIWKCIERSCNDPITN